MKWYWRVVHAIWDVWFWWGAVVLLTVFLVIDFSQQATTKEMFGNMILLILSLYFGITGWRRNYGAKNKNK